MPPQAKFFRSSSPYRFALEPAVSSPRRKWVVGRAEETGIVPASTWGWKRLNYLFRESGVRAPHRHTRIHIAQKSSATAILLTASPPGCLRRRHLFQICRIQFTPLPPPPCLRARASVYVCLLRPWNSFRTRFREFFPRFRLRHTQCG